MTLRHLLRSAGLGVLLAVLLLLSPPSVQSQITGGLVNLVTQVAGILPTTSGGTGASLSDPGADRILFWDDSAGASGWLTIGDGLTLADTTLTWDPPQGLETTDTPTFAGGAFSGAVTFEDDVTITGTLTASMSEFDVTGAVSGDAVQTSITNTSATADSGVELVLRNTDDAATGNVRLLLEVHSDDTAEAQASVSLDGAAGATPVLTFTTPAGVAFSSLTTTGAATGKTAVCADTDGVLYRSSASGSCAN